MMLAHRDFGGAGKPPVLLIHGMLGSARNWVSVARLLVDHFHVVALDMRNHGDSPHADKMDYPTMADDVVEWMDANAWRSPAMIGHSMGGKVVMRLLHCHGDRVGGAVIGDVAPKDYPPFFATAFRAMQAVEPGRCQRLTEADSLMAPIEPDAELRQFLVTNLKRREDGLLYWQINLESLTANLAHLSSNPMAPDLSVDREVLFLRGEFSRFVTGEDEALIRQHFPSATIRMIPKSGHNLHFDNRQDFCREVLAFLRTQ